MGGSAGTTFRGWLTEIGGAVLVAGGLLGLSVPVSQVNDEVSGRQPAPDGTGSAAAPAADYVGWCNSAIAHRRVWAMPMASLGALILLASVATWVRSRQAEPVPTAHTWSAEHPDDDMHEAQILDRRARSHWEHPSSTTL